MTQSQFRTLVFLLLAMLLIGVVMLYLSFTWSRAWVDVPGAGGLVPAPTAGADVALAAPLPTVTLVASPTLTPTRETPPTWTPTGTSTPFPTVTPSPTPMPSPTPSPTATPTRIVNPGRPTLAPVDITPTLHPSHTITVPTPVPLLPIPEDALTVVLLGSDQRPDWDNWRTDAIQYVVIYPDVPSVSILSIPRDLYIYIPGFWMSRINTVDMTGTTYGYAGGGFGLLNQALLYNLGISADYYAKVDMAGLRGRIDALGGIDMPVHCRLEEYWPYPNEAGEYDWLVLEPGLYHM
ncbi:MAG: LCP family protein, partial [Anaerolineae bacterium]|nr:LCP family protein [Anaerolineae bacterium]